MQTRKILLDSNAYFRIADNLFPLLSKSFGTNPAYKLYIHSINFIIDESTFRGLGCSRFDVECLATALELGICLVTDDGDLIVLASEYEVECMTTLELLKLMLGKGRVTMREIQDTVYMWDYMQDLPRNFRSDFISLFGIEPESYE